MLNVLVVVHGTWGRAQPWHQFGSPVIRALADHGFILYRFLWSGVLAGVPTFLPGDPAQARLGADDGMLLPWLDAGEKLAWFCRGQNLDRPFVLSHSHGLQVVSFAAALGQTFKNVLSISGPIRRDMQRCRRAARGNINVWTQVVDPTGADKTILEGEAFDGEIGWHLELPEADQTIESPGTGHSGLLDQFDAREWEELGLWKALGG